VQNHIFKTTLLKPLTNIELIGIFIATTLLKNYQISSDVKTPD